MDLFDEENIHTALTDQWENYGTLNDIEDERRESYADSALERGELLGQISTMIERCLTRQETEILRAYFGLQATRVSVEELAIRNGVSTKRIKHIIDNAVDKLRFSDDAAVATDILRLVKAGYSQPYSRDRETPQRRRTKRRPNDVLHTY